MALPARAPMVVWTVQPDAPARRARFTLRVVGAALPSSQRLGKARVVPIRDLQNTTFRARFVGRDELSFDIDT